MQPNVLLVMADQLVPHFTRAYEHPLVRTPAMEALVSRGARFDAAYCPSPLCAPSRFAMLSGQPVSASALGTTPPNCLLRFPRSRTTCASPGSAPRCRERCTSWDRTSCSDFERRLTTDIYPANFASTPDWNASQNWIDDCYNSIEFCRTPARYWRPTRSTTTRR